MFWLVCHDDLSFFYSTRCCKMVTHLRIMLGQRSSISVLYNYYILIKKRMAETKRNYRNYDGPSQITKERGLCGVVANVEDFDIVLSEFELQSWY